MNTQDVIDAIEASRHEPSMHILDEYLRRVSEHRASELEAIINRFRDCGVEIERFSIEIHSNGVTKLCVDGVPRFIWRLWPGDGE